MSPVTSVLIAAAQSVGKVYVIGFVGYLSVLYPKHRPLLPSSAVPTLARFSFLVLTMALIYGTTAQSISLHTIDQYWFVFVAALIVVAIAYVTATVLAHVLLRREQRIGSSSGRVESSVSNHNNHPTSYRADYIALRVAATFPNIVALPILIFPSLCEYPVVYNGYSGMSADSTSNNNATNTTMKDDITTLSLQDQCIANSNAMIFCYFFSWSLVFWIVGYPQLMAAATPTNRQEQQPQSTQTTSDQQPQQQDDLANCEDNVQSISAVKQPETDGSIAIVVLQDDDNNSDNNDMESSRASKPTTQTDDIKDSPPQGDESHCTTSRTTKGSNQQLPTTTTEPQTTTTVLAKQQQPAFITALRQTLTSPGFVALMAGGITGFIPPLQRALFQQPNGALLFLGDALLAMGQASSAISMMVVAASLVPDNSTTTSSRPSAAPSTMELVDPSEMMHVSDDETTTTRVKTSASLTTATPQSSNDNPIMSDPNFGPFARQRQRRRSSLHHLQQSVRRRSSHMWQSLRHMQPEQQQTCDKSNIRRLLAWVCLSSLVVSPGIVFGIMATIDCYYQPLLQDVPPLAKLVVMINSCLPGALIVVVLLKSNPNMSRSAAVVAQVYLPLYLLSIVTIAAWTMLGLLITVPDENGATLCHR